MFVKILKSYASLFVFMERRPCRTTIDKMDRALNPTFRCLPRVSHHPDPGASAEVTLNDVMYPDFTPLLPDLQPYAEGPREEDDVPRH